MSHSDLDIECENRKRHVGYRLKKSRVHKYYFAVFKDFDTLKEYDLDFPDHFDGCEIAHYDGYLNAFYIGHLN